VPQVTRVQLVLLELALALGIGAVAASGAWRWLCAAAGVVLAGLALVPVQRRWTYQLALSWLQLLRRRAQVRGPGLQSMLGGYRVVTVPAGSRGTAFGAVRTGTLWSLPLELPLEAVANDDAPVPVEQLAALLQVEDVPMASVRLITLFAPAQPSGGPPGPVLPLPRSAARYVVLTLDSVLAVDALAARGGSEAAINQILRRAALRCEQTLTAAGVPVRRLDEDAVAALFPASVGPGGHRPDGSMPPSAETWGDVRVAGTWSVSFAATGAGPDVVDALNRAAAGARTPIAATTLLLQRRGPHDALDRRLFLRLSGPGARPDRNAVAATAERAETAGLVLQRLDGEQGRLLRATTPVGVGR
jgi:type VII secretion protein EccE